jgi:hypothetical protein
MRLALDTSVLLNDFLVAARDRGYLRRYFPDLALLTSSG